MLSKFIFFIMAFRIISMDDHVIRIINEPTTQDIETNICGCLGHKYNSRVIGGYQVDVGYGWAVAIYSLSSDMVICTGALINNVTVLTAAHCISGNKRFKILAKYTKNWRLMLENDWGVREVIAAKYTKDFDGKFGKLVHKDDVALITIHKPFEFGAKHGIYPACLYLDDLPPSSSSFFYFTGYGYIYPYYSHRNTKKKITFTKEADGLKWTRFANDVSTCRQLNLSEIAYCVNGKKSRICNGDSGGPLHIRFPDLTLGIVAVAHASLSSNHNETVVQFCPPGGANFFIRLDKHKEFILGQSNPKCLLKKLDQTKECPVKQTKCYPSDDPPQEARPFTDDKPIPEIIFKPEDDRPPDNPVPPHDELRSLKKFLKKPRKYKY